MYASPKSALAAVKRASRSAALTPAQVVKVCDRARDTFDRDGWPDDWAAIQRAADGAWHRAAMETDESAAHSIARSY
jgi:hypothetical protein